MISHFIQASLSHVETFISAVSRQSPVVLFTTGLQSFLAVLVITETWWNETSMDKIRFSWLQARRTSSYFSVRNLQHQKTLKDCNMKLMGWSLVSAEEESVALTVLLSSLWINTPSNPWKNTSPASLHAKL